MTSPGRLPDLPEAISRDQVLQALEVLGLDPADLVAARIQLHGVEVDLFARTVDGQRYTLGGSEWRPGERERGYDRPATHRVCIPVVSGPLGAGADAGGDDGAEASP